MSAVVPYQTELLSDPAWAGFQLRRLLSPAPRPVNSHGPRPNPFSPWDKRLELKGLAQHVVLLNKYPVEPGHLLLISRGWQPQSGWLTMADWLAVSELWEQHRGLWFFNSGPVAGASQPHRHLQLLPRPGDSSFCPQAEVFTAALAGEQPAWLDHPLSCLPLPQAQRPKAEELAQLYAQLAAAEGLGDPRRDPQPLRPYNLLISPDWFALVPRSKEGHAGFNINALGFAGYLLVSSETALDWLRSHGPNQLLAEVVG